MKVPEGKDQLGSCNLLAIFVKLNSWMHLDFWVGILNSTYALPDALILLGGQFCPYLEFTTEPVSSAARNTSLCAAQQHLHDFRLVQVSKR